MHPDMQECDPQKARVSLVEKEGMVWGCLESVGRICLRVGAWATQLPL